MKMLFSFVIITFSSLSFADSVCSYREDGSDKEERTIRARSKAECLKKVARQLELHENTDALFDVSYVTCKKNGVKCTTQYSQKVALLELSLNVWRKN